ncbi:MAG: metalloregulator ArsR/SmtB family transcription factor [Actinomycetota bacterium]|nr:metalloregulator ArsR/SmtB family transcription factor [Actinomycetota bacterium]
MCQYVSVDQCCAPILETPVRPDEADTLATRFRALGDPARLRLLSLIASCGEVCACELVESIGVSQPTVSHHLKVLYEAGLVDRERRGKWIHYWVVPGAISALADTLQVPEPESVPIALRTG